MRTLAKIGLVAMTAALTAASTIAAASTRYPTPDPKQGEFFEQLQRGERPSRGKNLSAAARQAVAAAPAPANALATQATTPVVSTTFYFSAHPDDYALFMYPYRDVVRTDARVVFIFMTAGDAGLAAGPRDAPYYLARENGALRGVRFMADAPAYALATPSTTFVNVNGHTIRRVAYKNTVTYLLRLPDGNGDGDGFAGNGGASLAKLRSRQISTLRAVDGSATYRGWGDLVNTLITIVRTQAVGTPNVWLNTHDPGNSTNPGDHSDHWTTGLASIPIQTALPCVNMAYHAGYSNAGLVNLDLDDVNNKTGVFANYVSGMADARYPGAAWDDAHKSWLGSLVYRIIRGNGQACRF